MCSSKSLTILNNAHCYKSRDYKHGNRLWKLSWVKSEPFNVVANVNPLYSNGACISGYCVKQLASKLTCTGNPSRVGMRVITYKSRAA